jgi:hypothetical protein
MTVLPNAPIDAATGLPVPTIAVATAGGVSVIKDDRTVVSRSIAWVSSGGVFSVDFDGEGYWYNTSYHDEYDGTYPSHGGVYSFSDLSSTSNLNSANARADNNLMIGTGAANSTNTYWGADIDVWVPNGTDANLGLVDTANGKYFSSRNGLTVVEDDGEIFSYITKDYNTGYMSGKDGAIKLATLSDTDDTDVTGSELVTNGTFAGNLNNWDNNSSGTGSVVYDSGTGAAKFTRVDGNNNGILAQGMSLVSGQKYVLSFDVATGTTTNVQIRGYISSTNTTGTVLENSFAVSAGNSYGITFIAPSGEDGLEFRGITGTNTVLYLDNISVRLAEEDRSVNGNGLQVFGTVTKNPVATGADLVAYGPFSASNYLIQPYNSDLDVGTGDFCFMGWVKSSDSAAKIIFHRGDGGVGTWGSGSIIQFETSGGLTKLQFYTNAFASGSYAYISTNMDQGTWQHIVGVRQNGVINIYLNGDDSQTTTATNSINVSNTSAKLWVGQRPNMSRPWNGSMALHRFSTTVPSPEQIAKIYNDEKVLFQENAQATLYGSSDAVTALAYDDTTELLHVGTSAGRSVFQGLRRVDNTTDAVGAAISASNGLVAED